jgi:Protein of unknown function (DUF1059)
VCCRDKRELRGRVLRKAAAEHTKTEHGMDSIPPDVLAEVHAAIHDEGDSRAKGTSTN